MRLSRARVALACGLLWLVGGCAETVRSQAYPALYAEGDGVRLVAVAPFSVRVRPVEGAETEWSISDVAAAQISKTLAEALEARGIAVVAPEDVHRALRNAGAAPPEHAARHPRDPRPMAWAVAQQFGADALLVGEVYRFRERVGSELGSTRAASVGFEVTLLGAPGGQKLWTGVFDETQRAVSENVTNAFRYPAGGSRWFTAEELAHWGATSVADELPVSP